jgi:hypothetical protein
VTRIEIPAFVPYMGETTQTVMLTATVDGVVSNAVPFTILCEPILTGIVPPEGGVGATVTLQGQNFDTSPGGVTVKFGASHTSWVTATASSPNAVTVAVPATATSNVVVVRSNGTDSNGIHFTVVGSQPPATSPPQVVLTTPSGRLRHMIPIFYTLHDFQGDRASVQVQFSRDQGHLNWKDATPGPGGDPTSDLATSPSGRTYTFVWDSLRDLGALNFPGPWTVPPAGGWGRDVISPDQTIRIRVIPKETLPGSTATGSTRTTRPLRVLNAP